MIVGVAIVHLVLIGHRLEQVQPTLQAAEADVRNGQLAAAEAKLTVAAATVNSANNALHLSPDFAVLGVVPVARQNLQAVRQTVALALRMVGGGQQILASASPLQGPDGRLLVPLRAGEIPVQTIGEVASVVSVTADGLPEPDQRPHPHFLIGRIRAVQTKVFNEALRRRQEFSSVASVLRLVDEISGGNGNRRYLIAVANTAEMRGAGGMILSYGVLTSSAGHLVLEHVGPIDELKLPAPAPAPLPDDYKARFADLRPTQEWRNANLSSDFTVDGPVLESMYDAATGKTADGVIQIDAAGLAAILQGVGPVADPDLGQVNATNVVDLTLNQAYTLFPTRPVRQELLGNVAKEAFQQLVSGVFPSLKPLGEALAKAVADRHVIMHAAASQTEQDVTSLGASGSLPAPGVDFAQLTVQNFAGNKLDYYLDTSLRASGHLPAGRVGHVQAVIDITNTAPVGGRPPYVFGPFDKSLKAGQYVGLVTLYLPAGSNLSGARHDTAAATPTWQTEAGRTAIQFMVTLDSGGHTEVVLDVTLPPVPTGPASFVEVPAPRVRPTRVEVQFSG